ncbi:hypothetical protein E4U42_002445 [Claviceps africana]|uniref:Uncharacterized protein n=1 Tax=Claviceps africana TaxID=83212 RepID=A0A8K0NJQ2_9HYPO|nr:hypothetical protein E4U42_002445 [Claviceps africana]
MAAAYRFSSTIIRPGQQQRVFGGYSPPPMRRSSGSAQWIDGPGYRCARLVMVHAARWLCKNRYDGQDEGSIAMNWRLELGSLLAPDSLRSIDTIWPYGIHKDGAVMRTKSVNPSRIVHERFRVYNPYPFQWKRWAIYRETSAIAEIFCGMA